MKKQSLLTRLSTVTIFMSIIFAPITAYESKQYNIASTQNTIDPLIVLKGKLLTCSKELNRDMALNYLDKNKTSIRFSNITVAVNIRDKSIELIEGAILNLTKYDGEEISIDYKHNNKVLKTLKLKVECKRVEYECKESTFKLIGEAKDGLLVITSMDGILKKLDLLQYVDIEAAGGSENINIKIMELFTAENGSTVDNNMHKKVVGLTPKEVNEIKVKEGFYNPFFKVIYTLKNNPNIIRELIVCY